MNTTKIIALGGGSGSGKTTLARRLLQTFPTASYLSYDAYYRSFPQLSLNERAKLNYDDPAIFDQELFLSHLTRFRQGLDIDAPIYDFANHQRREGVFERVPAAPLLIVDGIMIYSLPRLREVFDYLVFVDCDPDIRLARRILRDSEERGRTPRSVIDQYLATVRPMHRLHVEPGRDLSDYRFPNSQNLGLAETEVQKLLAALRLALGL